MEEVLVNLSMENRIGIRLSSINFPNRHAVVVFELVSDGHSIGDPVHPLQKLPIEIMNYPTKEFNIPDYDEIVRRAALRLTEDFERMTKRLSEAYGTKGRNDND